MCDLISYHIPEAVRIEVIEVSNDDESDLHGDENTRRFSIDPQITDLSVLHSIIVRAFSIKSDFTLNYLRRDLNTFVPLKSDWDLDAAYINSSKPFLFIRMTTEKYNSLTDWDIITVADITRAAQIAANQTTSVANTLLHKVEKIVSKAFRSSSASPIESNPSPLNEKQYYSYLDSEGRIRSTRELRISIFRRGVDPILRRAVWKHLLNVYPPGLTGNQRYEYIKEKADEYHRMKNLWSSMVGSDEVVDYTINMVRKDVLRTDRMHPFYLGSGDDNPNVVSLLNILTTFALNHGVKYCQGMSDLVSPLLYAMKDEAQAYICFCALMRRLRENFTLDGQAISCKFDNLSRLLQYYDPDFYLYLKQVGAQDLLFCYRWILLELKREFPFDCALTMLEVLWSSIPPLIIDDLPLYEDNFRFQIGGTADALTLEAELTNGYHQHHHSDGEGNEGDVDEDVDGDLIHDEIDEDEDNYQKTNLNNKCEQTVNKLCNNNNAECQTVNNSTNSQARKQSNSSRNVKIPISNRRHGYRYGDRFCLMNHSLPEYGARFECADLENSGSIRIKGFFLNHNEESNLSALNRSAIDNHQLLSSSTVIPGKSVGRVAGLINHSIGVNGFSAPARNSLPHIMKSSRPLRTIRFLPKILSNDSREIDSPDAEESSTKQYSFPPKFDKGFSIDSDGDCRRLNSFESIGSSKNSSVDMDEDVESTVRHEARTTGAGLSGLKGSNDSGSSSSSSSSSSAAVRLRCQQRRRLFCRLGSSGGRDNSEPGSPLSPYSGSFGNGHEVETEYEQDLIVHCNGEYTDSRVNQQDWIIPRGLARSVSYECLKNLTVTSGSPTHENTCNGPTGALSVNGLRGSASNGSHLNGTGLTTDPDAPLGSRNSSSQGLEKERSEGYGSGSDPSDLMSEVHSAFGGTLDGNKSDSSSCSSLVILNSNGSTTTESTGSPSSSSQPLSSKPMLPSPSQLGSSNAFMLFLCLSILLQHRDKIMSSGLDCNEIAVYFDSYIRRHNVHSVLDSGRQLFHSYLSQWRESGENEPDLSQDFPPTT